VHAITAPPTVNPSDRLGFTLFVAIIAHSIVVLGVTFAPQDRDRRQANTLDVVLVQQKSEIEPEDAELLAQANQDGGGESPVTERPATPLKPPFVGPTPDIAMAALPAEPREQVLSERADPAETETSRFPEPVDETTPTPLLVQELAEAEQKMITAPTVAPTRPTANEPTPVSPSETESDLEPPPEAQPETPPQSTKAITAETLVSRSLAMASLSAEIDRRLQAYAKRPRRKWVTARTKEHKYAAYMEAWRQKVERVGNLNYPDEARRRRLSGNLLLDVAINSDGTINEVILRRSSGKKVLDDAAIRIVNLSAPYSRFPRSISEETDILHIERTWQFLSGNRFASR
jgi:protein TonB